MRCLCVCVYLILCFPCKDQQRGITCSGETRAGEIPASLKSHMALPAAEGSQSSLALFPKPDPVCQLKHGAPVHFQGLRSISCQRILPIPLPTPAARVA